MSNSIQIDSRITLGRLVGAFISLISVMVVMFTHSYGQHKEATNARNQLYTEIEVIKTKQNTMVEYGLKIDDIQKKVNELNISLERLSVQLEEKRRNE